jgi:hypothetical protein
MFSPTFTATQLPTVADEKIPQRVKDWAASAGMTPSEVVYIVNQIQSAARDYNPKLLIDFLLFPLHQEFRCPGDMIETPDEFVERFPELMDEKTRSGILNFMMEDLIINSYGVGLEFEIGDYTEVIWFSAYCNDTGCDNHHFVFITLLGYSINEVTWGPEYTPDPTYDPIRFKYGTYAYLTAFTNAFDHDENEWKTPDKTLTPYAQARTTITRTAFTESGFGQYGNVSCVYQALDFCPVDPTARVSAYDFGLTSVGELHVVCDARHIHIIDLLENDRLGYYVDYDHYFVLGLVH